MRGTAKSMANSASLCPRRHSNNHLPQRYSTLATRSMSVYAASSEFSLMMVLLLFLLLLSPCESDDLFHLYKNYPCISVSTTFYLLERLIFPKVFERFLVIVKSSRLRYKSSQNDEGTTTSAKNKNIVNVEVLCFHLLSLYDCGRTIVSTY
jgi:hypothetical protein